MMNWRPDPSAEPTHENDRSINSSAEVGDSRKLIEILSEDGTTFVPLARQITHLPSVMVSGVWQATMSTLDGEQWLFDLGSGIYALTTRGRVIRDLQSSMSVPTGYGIISLRASGSSIIPRSDLQRRVSKGPFMRILPPGAQAIEQLVVYEHHWQSVAFLVAANIWDALNIGSANYDQEGGTGELNELVALPMEILQPICDAAVVCVGNISDLIRARGLLLGLLAQILPKLTSEESVPDQAASVSTASMRHVLAAHDAVVRTLAAPPSQRRLARLVGTNERKLVEGFKNIYGVSPAKFTRSSRMEWARSLLLSGEISVTQLAATVGFADVATFSRAFRAHFGSSPLQMRRSTDRIAEGRTLLS